MRNTMRHFAVAISLMLAMTLPSFSQQHPIVEKDYVAYLFTYFTGNHISEEAVCYAVSMDGYTYWALNDGKPVLDSKVISSTGGVRDPHILRSQDGHTFYMVVTDMVSDNGWDSNRAMVLLKSNDLVNWTHSIINMQKRYKGQEKLKRVWAPQTVFDPEVGKYMVYWSMQYAGGADIIYYAYANDDFTDLIGEPKPLFIPENKKSCIDGDIVYKDGVFHLFYKTEGHGNGIKVATTRSLTSGQWEEEPDYKQQTKDAVEGAGTFKLINQQIGINAMPFHIHPYANKEQWDEMFDWIPKDMWSQLDIEVGMQHDVNGFPRAAATRLLDRDIHYIWTGINPHW